MSLYLFAGFGLGTILIGAHVGVCWRDRVEPLLTVAMQLMVNGLGFVAGIRVIYLCITAHSLGPFEGDDRIYLAMGGIALIWVSASSAYELLWE